MDSNRRRRVRWGYLAALLTALPALAQTTLFKWVDHDGVTHYSDSDVGAPKEAVTEKIENSPVSVIHNDLPVAPSTPTVVSDEDPWRLPPDPPLPPDEEEEQNQGGYGAPLWAGRPVRMSRPHFAFQNQSRSSPASVNPPRTRATGSDQGTTGRGGTPRTGAPSASAHTASSRGTGSRGP